MLTEIWNNRDVNTYIIFIGGVSKMSKTNWKKYAMGIVTASTALLLAACGGGDTETTETPDNGGADETAEDSGDTAGDLGGDLQVSVGPDYISFMTDVAAAFEEETGVSVEVIERDMFESLDALALDGPAGLAPDVMLAPYDRIGGLGQQGHLTEVTLVDDGRYDATDEQQVTMEDTIYGSPYVIEALIMYYNTDLLDAAPATFEELEALAQDDKYAYANEAGTNTAFLANFVDFYSTYGLLSGFGGYVFGQDGTDTSDIGLNSEGAIEAIDYASTWYDLWPAGMLDATSAGSFVEQTFLDGNAAAIIGGPWSAASFADMNFATAAIPTLPNGEAYEPFGGGKGWIISEYSENAEAAQAWLDYITNEENMQALHDFNSEVPANQAVRESIVEAGDNQLAISVVEQYSNSVPMPNIPQMAEVWVGAETMMFDAVSGNKTAEESANEAVQTISDNIEQKY